MDNNRLFNLTKIERKMVIEQEGDFLANNRDANYLWPGFFGKNYEKSKIAIIAHYPAGGTSSYETPTIEDRQFYDLITEFHNSHEEDRDKRFREMNEYSRVYIPKWSIYRVLQVLFNFIDITIDEIIYFNAIPFRIPNNRAPKKSEIMRAWNLYTEEMLDFCKAKIIVCLGVATGKIFQERYTGECKIFVLRRRIGDKSIDPEVYNECEEIRKYYNQIKQIDYIKSIL